MVIRMLTKEQMEKLEGYLALLKNKTNISIDADSLVSTLEMNTNNLKDFALGYKKTYADYLKDFVVKQTVSEIKEGKAPEAVGSYFGAAMDYLFDCMADEKTKENDAYRCAIQTIADGEKLRDLSEQNDIDIGDAKDSFKKDLLKGLTKEELEYVDAQKKKKEVEASLDDASEMEELLPPENLDVKKLDSIVEALIKLDNDVNVEYKKTSKDAKNAKNMIKSGSDLKRNVRHHILKDEYARMISSAFQENNKAFVTTPRYRYLASGHDDTINGRLRTEGVREEETTTYELDMTLINVNYTNMKAELRHGDFTPEAFNGMITLVSETYMVLNTKYNELGFFSKWFTKKGSYYRNEMANIKDPLKEGQDWLIRRGKTNLTLADGKTVDISKLSIRDELHNRAESIHEIANPEERQNVLDCEEFFDKSTNVDKELERFLANQVKVKEQIVVNDGMKEKEEVEPINDKQEVPENNIVKDI